MGHFHESGRVEVARTRPSARPSTTNPSFGDIIVMSFYLPTDPLYMPSINVVGADRTYKGWPPGAVRAGAGVDAAA